MTNVSKYLTSTIVKKKSFDISSSLPTKTFDELRPELDKCIVLCAVCHRRLHSLLARSQNDHVKYGNPGRAKNQARRKQIATMKRNGYTAIEIAKALGVTRQAVYYILGELAFDEHERIPLRKTVQDIFADVA